MFSSSATVYGDPQRLPLTEDHPLSTTNPYGQTKLVIEDMLRDVHRSDPAWRISILRYFNPVGAHASGSVIANVARQSRLFGFMDCFTAFAMTAKTWIATSLARLAMTGSDKRFSFLPQKSSIIRGKNGKTH